MAYDAAKDYTPTQLAAHIRKVWSKEIGLQASEEQVIVPDFKRLEKIEGELVYRKFATLQSNGLANGTSGIGLTNSGQTETTVSALPQTRYVMTVVNLNTLARCAFDPKTPLREQMQSKLYEDVDRAGGELMQYLTTNVVGGAAERWNDGLVRELKRKLVVSGKSAYKVGKKKYTVAFHPNGFDDLDAIEAFYRADIRGDAENPLVNGAMYQVRGGYWKETGNIQVDGVTRNVAFFPDMTFGIGFNKEYAAKSEEFELGLKLILWVDFAVAEYWDEYGCLVQTAPTAIS